MGSFRGYDAAQAASITLRQEEIDRLEKLLIDAVKKRMVADVPIGMFLSGGIDSSLVTAVAQSVSDKPVHTFSIGFYDKERNEAPEAAAISKYLETNHTEPGLQM